MSTKMNTTSSMCNDILTYLTTDPSRFSLSSLYMQAPTPSDSFFSCSPTTEHSADLTIEAHQSLWASQQTEISKASAPDGCTEGSCLLRHQSDSEIDCRRYKTELCRPFEESGFCKYGNRCQFAHGRHELRTVDRHPKYKTQLCKTFHTTGLCRYGKRCHFIHNDGEGGQIHRLGPQQQPAPGLRKLTGRHNRPMESAEEQQQRTGSFLSPRSVSSSASRYAEELSSVSGMSLPSSAASSPSPSLASFNDEVFSSSAAFEISQIPISRNVPTTPHSASLRATDLYAHPSILSPATDSNRVQSMGISSQDRSHEEAVDLLLRHLTKPQIELLMECLFQSEKRKTSCASSNLYTDDPLSNIGR